MLIYNVKGVDVETLGGGMRALLEDGRVAYGGWCLMPGALNAEIVSASGCDWICLDQQHGYISDSEMRVMVQAAAIRRIPVMVRVPWNEAGAIMKSLDAGADGVIVPMVNSADEAAAAVAAARYPPAGYRSWGPVRAGLAQSTYSSASGNHQSVVIVMIETVEAYTNLDEILNTPGVDGVLVGPMDLTLSHAGDISGAASSDRDVEMIEDIGSVCQKRGLAAAISGIGPADAPRWAAAGYSLLALPSEASLLGSMLADSLAIARGNI